MKKEKNLFVAVVPLLRKEKVKITWFYFLGYVAIHMQYCIHLDEYWTIFSFNIIFVITLNTTFIKDSVNE